MNWQDLIPLVQKAAPTIGSLLGGPIGGIAGNVLAEVLGVAADPASVNTALTTTDPATVQAKLSEAETRMNTQLETLKANLADTASARDMETKLVEAHSSIAYGPVVISVLVTVGFIGCLFALMFVKINFTETAGQAFLILTGILSQSFGTVINYWLGSSSGSADKSNQIAALATNAQSNAKAAITSKAAPAKNK